ncbi:hypothetical protein BWQ96_10699 [Gracilariopsis chorda]|uniref:Uncharacterized protein n=1 Tax=Gracilariopsis chorda TaxID=448386 RepID=A0A2V3IBX9_9FLOR|nr:hypothetical protein BWQ96_10699 [Gracilariopsis chorda]|eukprot:PXF39604.1 hypothetical protein BWQ96_10699 [Gracilariopsis chorda]
MYACSKPIVGRSGAGKSDGMMAGVEAVVEQRLLMAALFADGVNGLSMACERFGYLCLPVLLKQ